VKPPHRPRVEAAGFALPEADAELVVHLKIGPETDIVVADVDKAFALLSAGGEGVQRPFDIAIGRWRAGSRSVW
jgi:lactoylglutathione lyase